MIGAAALRLPDYGVKVDPALGSVGVLVEPASAGYRFRHGLVRDAEARAHVVRGHGELYLEDGLHRALRAALQQRHVLHARVHEMVDA